MGQDINSGVITGRITNVFDNKKNAVVQIRVEADFQGADKTWTKRAYSLKFTAWGESKAAFIVRDFAKGDWVALTYSLASDEIDGEYRTYFNLATIKKPPPAFEPKAEVTDEDKPKRAFKTNKVVIEDENDPFNII